MSVSSDVGVVRMDGLLAKVTDHFAKGAHIAHDIKHATRSAALAKYLAEQDGYDPLEAEVTALLHDIGRTVQKEERGHGPAGVAPAKELLKTYTDYDEETIARILDAINRHTEYKPVGSRLLYILQDADKLDGLGAIGFMRTYMSKHAQPDYDPDNIIPTVGKRDAYVHDQLAFSMEWRDMMHTEAAKRLAHKRYDFMVKFLEELKAEAEGADYLTAEL